ncbi:MAG: site-2 protease family protein [Actinomycetota bacterium]|nr:site-2 protease family protein [Actinomycetota bacterium]
MTATSEQPTDVEPNEPAEGNYGGIIGAAVVLALLGWLAYISFTMVLVVLVITFVVFMHEMGHFITARLTGMKATEFFLGFGPRVFSFRRGETEFGLKPILAGAYVKIIGMHNLDDVQPEDEDRTYRQKSYPRRVLVASAGSLMHFLMAFVGLVLLFGVFGDPVVDEGAWTVRDAPAVFEDGSAAPAGPAGLLAGDRVLSVDGRDTVLWEDFVVAVQGSAGQTVSLVVERGEQLLTLDVPIATDPGTGNGRIGVRASSVVDYETQGFLGAIGSSASRFVEMLGQTFVGIWDIFSNVGQLVDRVFSPPNDPSANENLETRPLSLVGAVQIGASDSFNGSERMLLFIGFNMFIGVFNLLPLLPLDGGHIAVATYERVREGRTGRRHMIDIARLMPITYAVVLFLIFFGVGAIYLDIANPINF